MVWVCPTGSKVAKTVGGPPPPWPLRLHWRRPFVTGRKDCRTRICTQPERAPSVSLRVPLVRTRPDPSGPVRTRLIRPSPSGPSGPSGPSVQHPTGVQSGHRHRSEPYTNTNIAESSKKAVFPWLFLTVPEPSSQNRGSALVLGPFLVPARWFGTAHPLPLYNHHQGQNGGGA